MKKILLILLAFTSFASFAQAEFPEGVQITGGQPTNTTPPFITTTTINGLQEKIPSAYIEKTANKTSVITGYSETLYPNEKATHDGLDLKLNISDLPANLTLYPTTAVSDVAGYVKMVTDIHDVDYNTVAVDVSTPLITTTNQLISQRISAAGVLIGQPGVFNITTFGNIRHLSGSGTASFYFEVYQRTSAGVETLICTSSNSLPVTNGGYSEFSASGVWDDGTFLATDRIVIKSYANRIAGGSDPVYQFQFGGVSPVRTILPVPFSVVDAGYELSANKVSTLTASDVLYPNNNAVIAGLATKQDALDSPILATTSNRFNKEYFIDSSSFTNIGNTLSYVNGRMLISGGTNDFTKYLVVDNFKNNDENIELELIFKATTLGDGIGIGKKSFNTWSINSVSMMLSTSSSFASITNTETGANAAGRNLDPIVAGNIIRLVYRQIGNEITCSFYNMTTGVGSQLVIEKNLGAFQNYEIPNASDIVIFNKGGLNEIISVKVNSLSYFNPDLLVVGDSKSAGLSALRKELRYASKLDSFGSVVVNAGSGDRTVEVTQTIDYTKKIKAKYALINLGRNDLASAVLNSNWQLNYTNIVSQLEAQGAIVYHLLPIPETVISDQSELSNWIISTYGIGKTIDPSIGWSNTDMLNADGIHPNEIGHQHIANSILSSGFLPSGMFSDSKNKNTNFVYSPNDALINFLTIGRGPGNKFNNVVSGYNPIFSNISGQNISANGYQPGYSNTSGSFWVANGNQAGYSNTTGSNFSVIGYQSAYSNTTGSNWVSNGYQAGYNNISGSNWVAIGYRAGRYLENKATSATSIANSIFLGYRTSPLADSQTNQIVIGYDAIGLGSNTTVIGNSSTLRSRIWGRFLSGTSVDDGVNQGQFNGTVSASPATLSNQVVVKSQLDLKADLESINANGVLEFNATDRTVWNNGKGNLTLNTSFGENSLKSNTLGSQNTSYGYDSLGLNTTGSINTAVGQGSLGSNISGSENNSFGFASLSSHTNGSQNTAMGYASLNLLNSGDYNTAVGYDSGRYIADGVTGLTTSNNSLFLGSRTKALSNASINEIVIGHESVGFGSNTVTLGNTSISKTILRGVIQQNAYTVATLPIGTQGMFAYVTDALAPSYLVTVVGGGTVVTPVFFNGSNWVSH